MTSEPSFHTGVVLFAHGSRDPLWRLPIDAVAQRMAQQKPHIPVAVAFLELTAPDLPTTVEDMMKQGLSHLRIVPMFLGVGRHAREDLPELVKGLSLAYPQVNFELLPAIGEHPAMTDLMAHIASGDSERPIDE
jgi:sirohydrochlorin cobaltochelatase